MPRWRKTRSRSVAQNDPLPGLVDDRLAGTGRELGDDVPAGLAANQDAPAGSPIADADAFISGCPPRTPALVGGQVGEIGPVPLARVQDREAGRPHLVQHAADGIDARARQTDVVAEQVDVTALAAKIGLHVDDDQRGVVRAQLAVPGPGVWISRNEPGGRAHPSLIGRRMFLDSFRGFELLVTSDGRARLSPLSARSRSGILAPQRCRASTPRRWRTTIRQERSHRPTSSRTRWRASQRRGADGVWIALAPRDRLLDDARALAQRRAAGERLPLYGLPFAVKDNIDVAGLPTTAACPAFAYRPEAHAPVVARLIAAGALVVGKTNLDQFATGLVGVRSPYGIPTQPVRRSLHRRRLQLRLGGRPSRRGWSASRSAPTPAGSGRVPAAFNNIVGLKPSRGLLQHGGRRARVPLARLRVGLRADGRGRGRASPTWRAASTRAIRRRARRRTAFRFRADAAAAAFSFRRARRRGAEFSRRRTRGRAVTSARSSSSQAMGGERVDIDFAPFREAGSLLYEGLSSPNAWRRRDGRWPRIRRRSSRRCARSSRARRASTRARRSRRSIGSRDCGGGRARCSPGRLPVRSDDADHLRDRRGRGRRPCGSTRSSAPT